MDNAVITQRLGERNVIECYRFVFGWPVRPLRPGVDDFEPCYGFVRLFSVIARGHFDQVFGSVGGEETPA